MKEKAHERHLDQRWQTIAHTFRRQEESHINTLAIKRRLRLA